MAGDWIKMRVWVSKDPKVIAIADYLASKRPFMDWVAGSFRARCDASAYECVTRSVTVSVTVCALLQVWGVACERGKPSGDDLLIEHANLSVIDEITGIPCFGAAMSSVLWAIEINGGGVLLPKFLKNNVPVEDRRRSQAAERQRRRRYNLTSAENVKERDISVTCHAQKRDKCHTREDKNREENTKGVSPPLTPKNSAKRKRGSAGLEPVPDTPSDNAPPTRPRDELFDLLAEVTCSDPKLHGGRIGRLCSQLRDAAPPYTAAEVRRFVDLLPTALPWVKGKLTFGLILEHIGIVRASAGQMPQPGRDRAAKQADARFVFTEEPQLPAGGPGPPTGPSRDQGDD